MATISKSNHHNRPVAATTVTTSKQPLQTAKRVALYNYLISTCGKCKKYDQTTHILEEMKNFEVKPTGQTFIRLLNAYAAAGRID